MWAALLDGPASSGDRAKAIVVDATGNAHATGFCTGSGTRSDFVTASYSQDGDTLWCGATTARTAGMTTHALALDGRGNCYVTGATEGRRRAITSRSATTRTATSRGCGAALRTRRGRGRSGGRCRRYGGRRVCHGLLLGCGPGFHDRQHAPPPAVEDTPKDEPQMRGTGPTVVRKALAAEDMTEIRRGFRIVSQGPPY